MAHLIDKDALVAEIERLKEENKPTSKPICDYIKGGIYGFDLAIEKTLSILDTLEVKEVDLEKEIHDYHITKKPTVWFNTLEGIAKHFFELGLKAHKGE